MNSFPHPSNTARTGALCLVIGGLLSALLSQVSLAADGDACPIRLRDITQATGIDFRHTDGSTGRRYIVETVTGGLALFDYDGDGDIDIYFLNGAPTPERQVDKPPRNELYRNDGDWRFTNVTDWAGVGETGFGLGVAVADYDNDGALDLYVNNFGPNVLYHNNGDGTFEDVTAQATVACGGTVGAGACFLDIEGDGDVDLYCANYVRFTYQDHEPLRVGGYPQYRSPKDYQAEPDVLYRNNGDGSFADISEEAGIAENVGTGMGIVCLDYDNDRDTDIAVLNDVRGNFLFENDGRGVFSEVGLLTGFGFSADGMALGSMGIDCADFNNDGWFDLFQTAYSTELPVLYQNSGVGFFEDVTRVTEAGIKTYPHVNWGVGFADFDNDGDRDLFLANGHLQDNIEQYADSTAYEVRDTLLLNKGNGKFVDVSDTCGDGLSLKRSGRGTGLDDLDHDGDIDIVILNSRREATVLRNDSETSNHWIEIRLRGTTTNRDGVGANVRVTTGDVVQMEEVHSGRGYQSHHGLRLHFGLGRHERIDRIEVRWVGGGVDVVEDVDVDRTLSILEGSAPQH